MTAVKTSTHGYTPTSDIPSICAEVRESFSSGITLDVEWRKQQLKNLIQMVQENKRKMAKACKLCFGNRSIVEISMSIGAIESEAAHALNNIDKWIEPSRVPGGMVFMSDTLEMRPHPLGAVLIISPWNFPWNLILTPLVGAIAAGCTAVLKPSEVHGPVMELLSTLLPKYMDSTCFKVVKGAVEETTLLLNQKWDMIFYTGNTHVGKIVMRAAAEHLTPVVLELGGKNPVMLDKTSDLDMVANRICQGRFGMNAGQMCIAPEYILTDESTGKALIPKLKKSLKQFFGEHPENSNSFGCLVNHRHFDRVKNLLEENKEKIVIGGKADYARKYISPTVVLNPSSESMLMENEVFGPILTIKTLPNFSKTACVDFVNARPKPLACYIFSEDKNFVDECVKRIDAGAIMQNDVFVHIGMPLPFGGVGDSGTGAYHYKASFDCFTHMKPVVFKSAGGEMVNKMIRYPPYTERKQKIMEMGMMESVKAGWPVFFKQLGVACAIGGSAAYVMSKL